MIKSIIAGYLIGLSSHIYSACDDKIVGAFLFGLGLLTICTFGLNLFTGKVGESKATDIFTCIKIFLGNALGVGVAVFLFEYPFTAAFTEYFSAGIVCGSLMQMAVSLYSKHPWATVMCVAAFLLSDAKHCIAMLYSAEPSSVEWWVLFLCVIIGNIIGAKIVSTGGVRKKVE